MMKNIKTLFVVMLLLFAMPIGVFADNETDNITLDIDEPVPTLYDGTQDNSTDLNDTDEDDADVDESTEDESDEDKSVEDESTEDESDEDESDVDESTEDESDEDKSVEDESTEDESDEDRNENVVETAKHAELLIVRLQERIQFQIDVGNAVITKLNEKGVDTENASLVIGKIEALIAKIDAVDLASGKDAIKFEFDLIREEAKTLSKEFKDLTKDDLTQEDRVNLGQIISELKKQRAEEHKAAKDAIKKDIRLKQIAKFTERLGVDATEILAKIESGNLTDKEIKAELKNLYKSAKADKKAEVVSEIKEEKTKLKIEQANKIREEKAKFNEKRKELREEFKARMGEIKADRAVKIEEYKAKLVELKEDGKINLDGLRELRDANPERFETIKEDLKENRPKLYEQLKNRVDGTTDESEDSDSDEDLANVDADSTDDANNTVGVSE